jgi:hypothetical protein
LLTSHRSPSSIAASANIFTSGGSMGSCGASLGAPSKSKLDF